MGQAKRRQKQKSDQSTKAPLNPRLKEGLAIVLSALSIFAFMTLVTYSTHDPGWTRATSIVKPQNLGGQLGAFVSDFSLFVIGYASYIIPILLAYLAYRLFKHDKLIRFEHKYLFLLKTIGWILIILSTCTLLSLHLGGYVFQIPESAGGVLGLEIANVLVQWLEFWGATLSALTSFLCGVTLATGFSWLTSVEQVGSGVLKVLVMIGTQTKRISMRVYKSLQSLMQKRRIADKCKEQLVAPIMQNKKSILNTKAVREEEVATRPEKKSIAIQPRAQTKAIEDFKSSKERQSSLPGLELLEEGKHSDKLGLSSEDLQHLASTLEERLQEFGVKVDVVEVHPGPVITRFELALAAGIKVSRLTGLSKDLARALSVISVRVVEVIPGKSLVGIEVPNPHREKVYLQEVLKSEQYQRQEAVLSMALGKDIAGVPVAVDLAKMPHLLVAGTTGSGKSVGVNAMIMSMLYKSLPENLRFILIDPKMLELSVYDDIPHLLCPVVTDMKDAANALSWCVAEMERRYQLMAALGVRNLKGYNQKVLDAANEKEPIVDPLWTPNPQDDTQVPPLLEKLPHIVVVIDEFADMIMVVGKKVEELIARIAQKARAAGIHMILATQRPSVDVITGLIKANVPTRIAFQVSSKIDSRTIIDQQGAEQLLGHGDMLYLPPGTGIPVRVHGAYVSDEEVHAVVRELKKQGKPDYKINFSCGSGPQFAGDVDEETDSLFDEAVMIVTESRKASISYLQRRLKIGFNRAARLIEEMEEQGVIGTSGAKGTREVLAPPPPNTEEYI